MASERRREQVPTVKGPDPAVCLTEQPVAALLKTLGLAGVKYSGYGVAYHKYLLHGFGGRPVLYGTEAELGRQLKSGERGYEEGKDIYVGGLPPTLQYLWVRYHPGLPGRFGKTVDFTWEREWRVKPGPEGLGIPLEYRIGKHAMAAVVVERDADVPVLREALAGLLRSGAGGTPLIVSLETAQRELPGDQRYARIETWPEPLADPV
jgi:hypothetical protein